MEALLTAQDVAGRLRVTTRTVNTWARRGLLPAVEIGGVRRYRERDVEAALARASAPAAVEGEPRPIRRAPVPPAGGEWNDVTHRPYGYTRESWEAMGMTKQDWLSGRQRQDGRRRGRHTTKRPA